MKIFNKLKTGISHAIKKVTNYELDKKVVIVSNKYIGIGFILYCLLIWVLIICWLLYNSGHIKESTNVHSTTDLSITGSFETNYTKEDFDANYVKPEEYNNYNQIWDYPDFVYKSSREIEVMTNVVITANQTQSICPESPLLLTSKCDPKNNTCSKGRIMAHGVQTGSCVKADFPDPSEDGIWLHDVFTCQIRGWCPVDRTLPPLKNYSAVLLETKNLSLWLQNSVEFPEFNLFLDNLEGKTTKQLAHSTYDPKFNPRSPVFNLGDLIKYTTNAGQTYEEIAKFGAVININIGYNCFVNSIFKPPEDNCKPSYSFRRVDMEKKMPAMGYTSYRFAQYFNYRKTRTYFRAYRIRFVVIVNAKVSKYDFFEFVTNLCAYNSIFGLSLVVFACFVKFLYRKSQLDDNM